MAITGTFPAVEVEILINDIALQKYDDDEDDSVSARKVGKYIEAVSGAEFAIRWRIHEKPEYDVRIDVCLDNKLVASPIAELHRYLNNSIVHSITGRNSNQDGKWLLSKFSFSDLRIVDSTSRVVADQLIKDLEGVGRITLHFHYIINLRAVSTSLQEMKTVGLGDIPEKALKGRALSHQANLGPPVPAESRNVVASDYLDPERKPFASVSFKYRSRAALKALLIIPRSPSPVPLEERDVDSLSAEEMRELLHRQRERRAAARTVKQERGLKRELSRERGSTMVAVDSDDDDVTFVATKRSRHSVITTEDGVETVDLT